MTSAAKPPLSQRINFRLLVVFGLAAIGVGWVLYTVIHETLTGGIEQRGDAVYVDLKAMSNYEMDQINATLEDVPKKWRDLDGKRIMLEGEMYRPFSSGDRLAEFQLVYSIAKCCFSGPKRVQHFVDATVKPDARVRLSANSVMVRVVGTLHVNVVREAGRIISVYRLDVERIDSV